jgi:succinoglycan biosynthesis transport protein ExoP
MLQNYKSPVQVRDEGSGRDAPYSMELSAAELLFAATRFIRRQILVVLSVVPLTVGLAVIYLFTTPPMYAGWAGIIIDTEKVQLFKTSILGDDPVTSAMVESDIAILKSDNFALSVIKNLQLNQVSEFAQSSEGLIRRVINLLLHPFASKEPETEANAIQRALRAFQSRLTVSRLGLTYIIGIEFRSTDPDRAAQVADAVADAFVVAQLEAKYQTIGTATRWLQDRLNELRAQASAADRAIVEYKTKNNIVDTGGHLINEQQLSELNSAMLKARANTVEAKARLDRVSQILSSDDLDPTAAVIGTVADALHSEVIAKLRDKYLDLAQREALLSNRLGRDHLAVVNLRNQMREVRRSILDEFKRIAEAYKSEYGIAKARENSLEASLAQAVTGSQTTNEAQIELRQLESAAQSYRALYDNFQQRYMDSVQQQSFPITEVRVVTRATRPTARSSPKSFIILAGAVISGLVFGLGLAILRDIADRVFRTSQQVEAQLKIECIAILPRIAPSAKAAPATNNKVAGSTRTRTISPNPGLLRYVIDSPLSSFAESMRTVKLTVDLSGAPKSNKVIGITSSLPDEGKSTVSASLAQLCAHSGARVILVDCDLRMRSLSEDLAPNATIGIIHVLTEAASLDEAIWSDPLTKLSFLPAVARSRLTHASDILASAAMKQLFERLRERYDYVIVDLSPLAPVADVRAATHLVDSYLLIVEWGKTKIDVVERALNTARGVYANLLGVILNKVDLVRLGRYDHSTHYSGYGYYTE